MPFHVYRFSPSAGDPRSSASNISARSDTASSRPAYRTQDGEVDVIAWDGDVLVFVEVKSLSASARPKMPSGPQTPTHHPRRQSLHSPTVACTKRPAVSTSSL